jgi:hypothetical protein
MLSMIDPRGDRSLSREAGITRQVDSPAETQRRRGKRRAHATTASWWNGMGNPGRRLACSGTAGGTGHRLVWPVVLRSVATSRQTTKSDRLSHRARRRINELRVRYRKRKPGERTQARTGANLSGRWWAGFAPWRGADRQAGQLQRQLQGSCLIVWCGGKTFHLSGQESPSCARMAS